MYSTEWVCETYVVHHFNSTGLCCAPLTCIVCHGANEEGLCLKAYEVGVARDNVFPLQHTLWWYTM